MILELTLAGGLIAAAATSVTLALQRAGDARSRAVVDGERMRLAFELEVTTKALAAATARISKLKEALSAEIDRIPNADLAPDDVASRLRRFEVAWGEDDLSAVGDGDGVPDKAPAAPTAPGELPAQPATELR